MLTRESLAKCMECPPSVADAWFDPLSQSMSVRRINTPRRIGHFLAVLAHESAGLTRGEENLRYSAKRLAELAKINGTGSRWAQAAAQAKRLANNPVALASFVYANRNGNGDEASGDGWRYRGRGPIGLTFRGNYAEMQQMTGIPLLRDPDLLTTPDAGAAVACAFWERKGLNPYADMNDPLSIARIVNMGNVKAEGIPIGYEDRLRRTKHVFAVLGVT